MGSVRVLFVVLAFALTIVGYADRQMIALLKPALDRTLGWSASDYATITTLSQAAAALSLLGAGWFVDRVGVVRSVAIGLGGWSLSAVAHAVLRTVSGFAAARVALGAFESVGTPSMVKAVAILFEPARRPLALGILNVAPNAAAIATPLLFSLLFARLGWRLTVVAIGASGLVLLLVWLVLPLGRAAPALGRPGRDPAAPAPVPPRRALADPRLWIIGLSKLLIDQAWWFMLFWLPDFFHRRYGLGVGALGAPVAAIYATAALGAFAGGAAPALLARRGLATPDRGRRLVMGIAALTVLPVALVGRAPDVAAATALLGLALASHQAFSTNVFALIADAFPVGEVGFAMGVAAFCGNVGGILSLRLAGTALDLTGTLAPMFAAAAVSYALAWLVLGLLGAPPRPLSPAPRAWR